MLKPKVSLFYWKDMADISRNAGSQGRKQNFQRRKWRRSKLHCTYLRIIYLQLLFQKTNFQLLLSRKSLLMSSHNEPIIHCNEKKAAFVSVDEGFQFPHCNRIVIKGRPVTEGKSTSFITRWTGHPQSLESPVLEGLTHCSGEQQIPAAKAPEKTTGSVENKNNSLSLDHPWVPVKHSLCPVYKCVKFKVVFPQFLKPIMANWYAGTV